MTMAVININVGVDADTVNIGSSPPHDGDKPSDVDDRVQFMTATKIAIVLMVMMIEKK